MARQTHLIRRSSRYYWRQRIPADLIALVGRTEITKSLLTGNYRSAVTQARFLTARFTLLCETAREQGTGRHDILNSLAEFSQALHPTAIDLGLPLSNMSTLESARGPARDVPTKRNPISFLSQVIASFVEERRELWTQKTRIMNEASLKLFLDHQGDRCITKVDRADLRSFKELLRRLPPNYTKRFRGKTPMEAVELGVTPISAKTVNKNLSIVSSLFTWAIRNGYCNENPAKGLALPIKTLPHEERDAFNDSDLKKLFNSPIYEGCLSAQRRSTSGTLIIKDEKYWLPLIALYSGMRLEEIAQLRGADILRISGVLCFVIHGNLGNRIKSRAAERVVPVHSSLVHHGILEYAAALPATQETLWPNLRRGADGTLGSAFSKWFSRHCSAQFDRDRKLSFHSFRHSFASALKNHEIQRPVIEAILGHVDRSDSTGRYGKPYSPAVLKRAVERFSPPLNFSRFKKIRGN